MMLSFLFIFWVWGGTLRIAGALALFYPVRNVIQTIFLMGRPKGFLWSYPGIHSLTVPYFDTNDFYFSGHVGSTTVFSSEYLAMKYYKMAAVIIFVVVDVWIALTFLRTHYIIDFLSGYAYARFVHRIGEKLSYYPDVKLLGWRRQNRFSHHYDPCPKCGWGNDAVVRLTVQEDLILQKELRIATLSEKNQISSNSPLMGTHYNGLSAKSREDDIKEEEDQVEQIMPSINGHDRDSISRDFSAPKNSELLSP